MEILRGKGFCLTDLYIKYAIKNRSYYVCNMKSYHQVLMVR